MNGSQNRLIGAIGRNRNKIPNAKQGSTMAESEIINLRRRGWLVGVDSGCSMGSGWRREGNSGGSIVICSGADFIDAKAWRVPDSVNEARYEPGLISMRTVERLPSPT